MSAVLPLSGQFMGQNVAAVLNIQDSSCISGPFDPVSTVYVFVVRTSGPVCCHYCQTSIRPNVGENFHL